MNTVLTRKTTTTHIDNFQTIRLCAFCFAIVSCFTTANGLQYFVFEQVWVSALISFAIQGILFIFNLKLPEYIITIQANTSLRNANSNYWHVRLFSKVRALFSIKTVIIIFYIMLVLVSSSFSFVFIVNSVYKSTTYTDADIDIDSKYRDISYEAMAYINDRQKHIEDQLMEKIVALENSIPNINTNITILDELGLDVDTDVRELKNFLKELTQKRDQALEQFAFDQAEWERVSEKSGYVWNGEIRYRTSLKEAVEIEVNNLRNIMNASKLEYDKLANQVLLLENYLGDPHYVITNSMTILKSELVKPVLEPKKLDDALGQLFAEFEITDAMQADNDIININRSLKDLQYLISQYTNLTTVSRNMSDAIENTKSNSRASIPDPDDVSAIEEWRKYWAANIVALQKNLKAIPITDYNTTINNFDINKSVNDLDLLQRNYITKINNLERAKNLLFSRFNFLAIFALCLAIFLDIAAVLAGLMGYYAQERKKAQIIRVPQNND